MQATIGHTEGSVSYLGPDYHEVTAVVPVYNPAMKGSDTHTRNDLTQKDTSSTELLMSRVLFHLIWGAVSFRAVSLW